MGEKCTFAYDQHNDCPVQKSPTQLVQPFQIDSYLPVGTHTSLVSLPTEVLIMSYLRLLHQFQQGSTHDKFCGWYHISVYVTKRFEAEGYKSKILDCFHPAQHGTRWT